MYQSTLNKGELMSRKDRERQRTLPPVLTGLRAGYLLLRSLSVKLMGADISVRQFAACKMWWYR
jgi:hypothetical protein